MESGSKRTQRDYTLAFQLSVVEQVEKGELTYRQAQARYGIQGRSTVPVWLRNAKLLVPARRAYHNTTDSHHRFRRHPKLLKAGEQVWVADITYLPTADKFVYLSLVTEACSRKIVVWHVHDNLQCSMTDGCHCYQNALAKRVNGTLKGELLLQRPADLAQTRRMVRESVQICNSERHHLSLKMQTPDAVHRASLAALHRPISPSQVSTSFRTGQADELLLGRLGCGGGSGCSGCRCIGSRGGSSRRSCGGSHSGSGGGGSGFFFLAAGGQSGGSDHGGQNESLVHVGLSTKG